MDTLIQFRDWLDSYGIWALILLAALKTLTGIFVALEDKTFKWSKIGDTFKDGGFLQVAAFAVISFITVKGINDANIIAPLAVALTAALTAGVLENLGRLFPSVWAVLPTSLRK